MENRIYFGTAGWSYKDWYGTVYPIGSPGFKALEFLIRYVDTVEINSTFYRPCSPKTSSQWVKAASIKDDFLFTAKLWQVFTHSAESFNRENVKIFKQGLDPIAAGNRLGALLIQFPWSYDYSPPNLERIVKLAEEFRDYNPCIELRRSGWENNDVLDTLKSYRVGFVNIDQPKSKTAIYGTDIVTSGTAYLRLHGRNSKAWFDPDSGRDQKYDYFYKDEEIGLISSLAGRIATKAKRTFVIANNHFAGSAFANSLELKARTTGKKVVVPQNLLLRFPHLLRVASSVEKTQATKQTDMFEKE